jgi:hypothetical protein
MAISKIKSNSLQDDISLQGKTVKLPAGTASERPTGTEAQLEAQFRFNNVLNKTELHDGKKWDQINTQSTSIALNIALGS